MQIISGLIVSVDAFFVGLALGLQKGCRFIYLVAINLFLLCLCMVGFFIAVRVYSIIPFDTDIVVGLCFIALGLWCIAHFAFSKYTKAFGSESRKTIVLVGLVMSLEAMIITMGITFIFQPHSTIVVPITVAFAHFGYSALSFLLARTRQFARIPVMVSNLVSGLALIVYGLMALFVEIIAK